MKALDKLHHIGYVHPDVRLANFVFPDDDDAKLIDFDLADEVDKPYPYGYNYSNFPECHILKLGQMNLDKKLMTDFH